MSKANNCQPIVVYLASSQLHYDFYSQQQIILQLLNDILLQGLEFESNLISEWASLFWINKPPIPVLHYLEVVNIRPIFPQFSKIINSQNLSSFDSYHFWHRDLSSNLLSSLGSGLFAGLANNIKLSVQRSVFFSHGIA